MAHKTLPREKHQQILEQLEEGKTFEEVSEYTGVSLGAVSKYSKKSLPPLPGIPPVKSATLPKSHTKLYPPVHIDSPGLWGVLCDVHLPYHDRKTIELAFEYFKRRKPLTGLLLNGDLLDFHEASDHDKDPSAPRVRDEIEKGKEFLAYCRRRQPKARIVYKLGNHDERLDKYIIRRAPALFDLEGVNVESLLHLADYGVEAYRDKRLIKLGKLNVLHGHEHRGGTGSSPVNPARGAYLKCRSVVMIGHHHRPSFHPARNVKGEIEAAWSVGCCCDLYPRWLPFNDWLHGFALVDVQPDGTFSVENKTVMDGKVV